MKDRQRGSVSPVMISLLLVALLLLIVIVDREWMNYTLKDAYQTADFAAEAGAMAHEVYTTITVDRLYFVLVPQTSCTTDPETGIQSCFDTSYHDARTDSITLQEVREKDLVETWRTLASCGNPYQESPRQYQCDRVQVDKREVRFTADTREIALDTFHSNWRNREAARAESVEVIPVGDAVWSAAARQVQVVVVLDVKSLFGMTWWHHRPTIISKAVVTLAPLQILP